MAECPTLCQRQPFAGGAAGARSPADIEKKLAGFGGVKEQVFVVCWNRLESVGICWKMLEYLGISWNILIELIVGHFPRSICW